MNWIDFLFRFPTLQALLLGLGGLAAMLAGGGYRKLGVALILLAVLSTCTGAVGFVVGFGIGASIGGRGEGSGLAAFLFAIAIGIGVSVLTFIGGLVWIGLRRRNYVVRQAISAPALLLGALALVCAAGVTVYRFPRFRTTDALLRTAHFRSEERAELIQRGPEAARRIVDSLHRADPEQVKIYENGLNGRVITELQLLGEIGGPEAVNELRAWLKRDCAPDIRSAAARSLAVAGDSASAADIGALLDHTTYEWRKEYVPLIHALAELKAADQTPHIRNALMSEMGDGHTNMNLLTLNAAIIALMAFDTPEAWQVITEIGNMGDEFHRAQVRRIVTENGGEFPEAAPTGSAA